MAKKLSYESLEERNLNLADDIIKIADDNATLKAQVAQLEKELSEARATMLGLELDSFEAERDALTAEAKWDNTRFALRDFGGHQDSCPAWPRTRASLHHACKCGWNFYATKLERAFHREN